MHDISNRTPATITKHFITKFLGEILIPWSASRTLFPQLELVNRPMGSAHLAHQLIALHAKEVRACVVSKLVDEWKCGNCAQAVVRCKNTVVEWLAGQGKQLAYRPLDAELAQYMIFVSEKNHASFNRRELHFSGRPS